MDITPQEKIRIYKEELLARRQQSEANDRKKVETLTQAERDEIYNDINQYPSAFLEEADITKPYKGPEGLGYILTGIAVITMFFYSFYLGIAVVIVGSFIEWKMGSSVYKIRYKCPACGHEHAVSLYWEDEHESFRKLGYIIAKCHKCSQDFNLYAESLYGNTIWKIKR